MSGTQLFVETTLFTDNYKLLQVLGTGAFSTVRKCVQTSTGTEYAVKIIDTWRMTARERRRVIREEQICQKLHHPHIVRLFESISEKIKHYFVFELVEGGELLDHIVERTNFTEADASNCFQQILLAVSYIHKMNIVHRDLKPENLLLSTRGPDALIKVADFGLAIQLKDGAKEWYGFAGTSLYMAPEIVSEVPYGKAIDMWSCGVILYVLLIGCPPFWHFDLEKLYEKIKCGEFSKASPLWESLTSDAQELIGHLLTVNPDERISVNETFEYPWIWRASVVASAENRRGTIDGLKDFRARRLIKDAALVTVPTSLKSHLSYGSDIVIAEDIVQQSDETTEFPRASMETAPEETLFGRVRRMVCVVS